MRNKIFALLIIVQPFVSCTSPKDSYVLVNEVVKDTVAEEENVPPVIKIDAQAYGINVDTTISYAKQLAYVNEKRLQLKAQLAEGKITMDSVCIKFCDLLLNNIIPYWYGTVWSFEGHTDVPNRGEIACGYFISTTMKHMGLNLDRYKMAQQPALNAMKSITTKLNIVMNPGSTPEKVVDFVKKKKQEGIYIIGLDYHVGFLLYKAGEVFFIHSSYLNPYKVTIEYALNSPALVASNTFCFAPVSGNEALMNKWLESSAIEIVTK